MIKLRDTVSDTITGLEGVVIARCEYLNGCVQFEVQPKGINKDGEPFKPQWIDEGQLEIIGEPFKIESTDAAAIDDAQLVPSGGPQDHPVRLTPPL